MSGIYEHAFARIDGPFPVIYSTDLWSSDQELEQIKIYNPSPLPAQRWGSPSSVMSWDVAVMAQFSAILARPRTKPVKENVGIWAIHK